MLYSVQTLAAVLAAFWALGDALSFSSEVEVPAVEVCINLTTSSQDQSRIYYCTNNTLLRATYTNPNCQQDYDTSITFYGGCTTAGLYSEVEGCTEATDKGLLGNCAYWTQDNGASKSAYPLQHCVNTGSFNSKRYDCYGDDEIYSLTWNNADCTGFPSSNSSVNPNSIDYNGCGNTESCTVTLALYTLGGGEYCQYEEKGENSRYGNPSGGSSCNYIQFYSGDYPYGVDVCNAHRSGYYEYSTKLECNDDGDVVSRYYLDSANCDEDGEMVNGTTYSHLNHTIVCDASVCNNMYLRYYSGEGCSFANEYSSAAIVWNLCMPVVSDPDDTPNTYQARQYHMYTCFPDRLTNDVEFNFLDSSCSNREVFDPNWDYSNYEENDCRDTTLVGCSNSGYAGESRLSSSGDNDALDWYYFVIIALGVVALVLLIAVIVMWVKSK